jgi:hypothetical protein
MSLLVIGDDQGLPAVCSHSVISVDDSAVEYKSEGDLPQTRISSKRGPSSGPPKLSFTFVTEFEKYRSVHGVVSRTMRPKCVGLADKINADSIVSSIVSIVKNSFPELSTVVYTILRSLLVPFCTFISFPMDPRDFRRFCNSMAKTARCIQNYEDDENREIGFVKYHLNVLMCEVFGDDQRPLREDWIKDSLFNGWCRVFVNRRIVRGDRKSLAFVYSLAKGSPKSWPKLGIKKQLASMEKHKKLFTSSRPPSSLAVVQSIRSCSNEVFSGLKLGKKFCPTGRATSTSTMVKGGSFNDVAEFLFPDEDDPNKPKGPPPEDGFREKWQADVLSAVRDEKNELPLDDSKPLTSRIRDVSLGPLRDLVRKSRNLKSGVFGSCVQGAKLIASGDLDGDFLKIVCLPEPGKFRILSCGPGLTYTALQPLQAAMLSAWKKHPSSTMLLQDYEARLAVMKESSPEGFDLYCSVDYESATDTLSSENTFDAFSAISSLADLGHKSTNFRTLVDLALQSLKPKMLTYPTIVTGTGLERKKHCIGKDVPSLNGQPMGHPLSFPLLCTINLSVYKETVRRYSLAYKPIVYNPDAVIINGDDMLFASDEKFYLLFLEVSREHNFVASIGKNFLSPKFAMINSKIFDMRGLPKEVGYVNQKLFAKSSLKTGDSYATPCGIAAELNRVRALLPEIDRWVPLVFNRWKDAKFSYRKAPFTPNWHVPVHLGGFGLEPILSSKVTRQQRFVAAEFARNPKLSLFFVRNDVQIQDEWIVKSRVLDSLPDPSLVAPDAFGQYCLTGPVTYPTCGGGFHTMDEPTGRDFVGKNYQSWFDLLTETARFVDGIVQPSSVYAELRLKHVFKIPNTFVSPMSLEKMEQYSNAILSFPEMSPAPDLFDPSGVRVWSNLASWDSQDGTDLLTGW